MWYKHFITFIYAKYHLSQYVENTYIHTLCMNNNNTKLLSCVYLLLQKLHTCFSVWVQVLGYMWSYICGKSKSLPHIVYQLGASKLDKNFFKCHLFLFSHHHFVQSIQKVQIILEIFPHDTFALLLHSIFEFIYCASWIRSNIANLGIPECRSMYLRRRLRGIQIICKHLMREIVFRYPVSFLILLKYVLL